MTEFLQHHERTVSESVAGDTAAVELGKVPSEGIDSRDVEVEFMPSPTDKTGKTNKNCDKSYKQLMDFMLQNYNYIIDNFQEIGTETSLGAPPFAFEVHLWLNIDTAIDAQTWRRKLEEKMKTTYRVTKGTSYRMTGQKVVYKTIRHCQHKQKKPTRKMTQSSRDRKFGAPTDRLLTHTAYNTAMHYMGWSWYSGQTL